MAKNTELNELNTLMLRITDAQEKTLKMVAGLVARVMALELEAGGPEDDDEDEDDAASLGESREWLEFMAAHPELAGKIYEAWSFRGHLRPEHYSYSHSARYSDALIVRGLVKASAGHPEGVTTKQVLAAMFGTADESRSKVDDVYGINDELARPGSQISGRLYALSLPNNGAVVQRTRKRVGGKPALWLVATDDIDDGKSCHTVGKDGKYVCGTPTKDGKPTTATHFGDDCVRLGHKMCLVCEVIGYD